MSPCTVLILVICIFSLGFLNQWGYGLCQTVQAKLCFPVFSWVMTVPKRSSYIWKAKGNGTQFMGRQARVSSCSLLLLGQLTWWARTAVHWSSGSCWISSFSIIGSWSKYLRSSRARAAVAGPWRHWSWMLSHGEDGCRLRSCVPDEPPWESWVLSLHVLFSFLMKVPVGFNRWNILLKDGLTSSSSCMRLNSYIPFSVWFRLAPIFRLTSTDKTSVAKW